MKPHVDARSLSSNELELLRVIVDALDGSTSSVLHAQIDSASVTGGRSTFLDLAVDSRTARSTLEDGCLPVRAIAPSGEVLVWIASGALSGLEFAWTSDDPPTQMPPADSVTVTQDPPPGAST